MRTRTTEMHAKAWAHQRSQAGVRLVKVMPRFGGLLRSSSIYLQSAS